MIISHSWSLRPQKVTLIYLLAHSVHFADHHFHLISTQMTQVQDTHHVSVLQLADGRQDLFCERRKNNGFRFV